MTRHEFSIIFVFFEEIGIMLLFSKMDQFIQFIAILLIKLPMLSIFRLLFSVVELILLSN